MFLEYFAQTFGLKVIHSNDITFWTFYFLWKLGIPSNYTIDSSVKWGFGTVKAESVEV